MEINIMTQLGMAIIGGSILGGLLAYYLSRPAREIDKEVWDYELKEAVKEHCNHHYGEPIDTGTFRIQYGVGLSGVVAGYRGAKQVKKRCLHEGCGETRKEWECVTPIREDRDEVVGELEGIMYDSNGAVDPYYD